LDIRALRDEGIIDVPDTLSDDAESVYALDIENTSENGDKHHGNDGDLISGKSLGVEPE
jgi:hypothetical protein